MVAMVLGRGDLFHSTLSVVTFRIIVSIVAILQGVLHQVGAVELFPFGSGPGSQLGPQSDDIALGFTFPFEIPIAGGPTNYFHVDPNGFIAFNGTFNSLGAEPMPLTSTDLPVISGIWADINVVYGGAIWLQITGDEDVMEEINKEIHLVEDDFDANFMFAATWFDISSFSDADQLFKNSFQLIVVADRLRSKTYAVFNVNKVQWYQEEIGFGFNYGYGSGVHVSLPYGSDGDVFARDILKLSNVNIPGKFIVRIDGGEPLALPVFCDAPPVSAPLARVDSGHYPYNGDNVTYLVGSRVLVQCLEGPIGFESDNKTLELTCMSTTNKTVGEDRATLELITDDALEGTSCTCVKGVEGRDLNDTRCSVTFVWSKIYPPDTPPSLSIDNGAVLPNNSIETLREGDNIRIKCVIVEEGFSLTERVRINCGQNYSVEDTGDEAVLTLTLIREMHQVQCTCAADHPAGPYDLISTFSIVVQYPPASPPSVTINNGSVLPINGNVQTWTTGETIHVNCEIEGGKPRISTVSLTCNNETIEVDNSTMASLTLTLDRHWNGKRCSCGGNHATGLYDTMSVFTLNVLFPPLLAPMMTINNQSNTIANNSVRTYTVRELIDVKCVVTGGNPGVQRIVVECGDNGEHREEEIDGTEATLSLVLDKHLRNEMCICEAHHVTGFYDKLSQFMLYILYPPTSPPSVTINNGSVLPTNGNVQTWTTGETIHVNCEIEGGDPRISTVVVTCENETIEVDNSTTALLTLTLDWHWNGKRCLCRGDHVTGLYDLMSVFTLDVLFPPLLAPMMTINNQSNTIANNSVRTYTVREHIDVKCVVTGGNPGVQRIVVECGDDGEHREEEINGTEATLSLVLDKHLRNEMCICEAHHVTGFYDKLSQFMLNVIYPPQSAPILNINNGSALANDTTRVCRIGETIEVHCEIEGGNPSVDRVVVECGNQTREATNTTHASLEISVDDLQWDGTTCSCRAEHISGYYNLVSLFTIMIEYISDVTIFEIQNQVDELRVEAGTPVVFECMAEGSPLPAMSVVGQMSGRVFTGPTTRHATHQHTGVLRVTQDVMCLDSDLYVCVAENAAGSNRSEYTIGIQTVCGIHLLESENYTSVLDNSAASITFTVTGRPKPNAFILTKHRYVNVPERRKRSAISNSVEIDPSTYRVTYRELNVREGSVLLEFIDFNILETNNYTLVMSNGLDKPISVDFYTTKVDTDKEGEDDLKERVPFLALMIVAIIGIVALCVIPALSFYMIYRMFYKREVSAKNTRHNRDHKSKPAKSTKWMKSIRSGRSSNQTFVIDTDYYGKQIPIGRQMMWMSRRQ